MHKRVAYALTVAVFAVSLLILSAMLHAATSNRQADVIQTSRGELRLTPLYHGSVMLEFGGKIIHVDPWSQGDYTDIPQADLIVVTHTHRDHLDPTMIDKLKKPGTNICRPAAIQRPPQRPPALGQAGIRAKGGEEGGEGPRFGGVAVEQRG